MHFYQSNSGSWDYHYEYHNCVQGGKYFIPPEEIFILVAPSNLEEEGESDEISTSVPVHRQTRGEFLRCREEGERAESDLPGHSSSSEDRSGREKH